MKIAITGATGLIGKRLATRLAEAGHSLILFSRDADKAKKKLGLAAEYRVFREKIDLSGAEAVIHLAGEPIAEGRWTEARKKLIMDSRVATTRAVAQAIRDLPGKKPSVWISASAIGYYGDQGNRVLDEESPTGTGFLAEVCRAWEAESIGAMDFPRDTRRAAFRFGVVLSAEGGALSKLAPVFRAGLGGPIGMGKRWMSWIHIDDLVSALVFALQTESLKGPVNAVAPEPSTNAEFTRALAQALHRPAFFRVPTLALRAALGQMSEAILSSQRAVPTRLHAGGFKFRHPDLFEALRSLYA
ncbi:MAG: TIGR01777 family oxidoreductase [Oligoflexia bacterium]|nr:TIGR01777 family oxidoreductase [Oligoflexia bacterium]